MASEKAALEELRTAEYVSESQDLSALIERRESLRAMVHQCNQTLDSLADCLATTGLEQLVGPRFSEWLCDVGLWHLHDALKDVDGESLTMFTIDNVIECGVSFSDAAALQLRAYIAHCQLGEDRACEPPEDTVLSWTDEETADWIGSLDPSYACLASANWHGAALCSLSPLRVMEASKGTLKSTDAVKFLSLVRAKRREEDGDRDSWVVRWTGANTIESQVP